jgi:hypothetical protein
MVRFKVPLSVPHGFATVSVIANDPGLVGVPEMVPVAGSITTPCGRKLGVNVCGFVPFVLNVIGVSGAPVPPVALVLLGVNFGG